MVTMMKAEKQLTPQQWLAEQGITVEDGVPAGTPDDLELILNAQYHYQQDNLTVAMIEDFRKLCESDECPDLGLYPGGTRWFHTEDTEITADRKYYTCGSDDRDDWIPVDEIVFPNGQLCWYEKGED